MNGPDYINYYCLGTYSDGRFNMQYTSRSVDWLMDRLSESRRNGYNGPRKILTCKARLFRDHMGRPAEAKRLSPWVDWEPVQ